LPPLLALVELTYCLNLLRPRVISVLQPTVPSSKPFTGILFVPTELSKPALEYDGPVGVTVRVNQSSVQDMTDVTSPSQFSSIWTTFWVVDNGMYQTCVPPIVFIIFQASRRSMFVVFIILFLPFSSSFFLFSFHPYSQNPWYECQFYHMAPDRGSNCGLPSLLHGS
jgi:hypothetical protein